MRFLLFFPTFIFAAYIFVLHRIDDYRYPSTNTSSKELVKYFDHLKKHNYKVVTLSQLIEMIKQKKNIDKVVVFTIDDGYKSFYKNGVKIFRKYNYPFSVFVYVKATNNKWGDFMGWKEIKEIQKYGEIGIHSYAHPHLARLTKKEIIKDTQKAINIFKKHMGYIPKIYAYPYGEYNEKVKSIIKQFFPYIVNQNSGYIDINTPLDDLDRIALTGKVNFKNKLKLKRLSAQIKIFKNKNKITKICANIKEKIPYVNLYLTGFGWKREKLKNNFFCDNLNFTLKRYRNRIILSYNYKIISKLILKEE